MEFVVNHCHQCHETYTIFLLDDGFSFGYCPFCGLQSIATKHPVVTVLSALDRAVISQIQAGFSLEQALTRLNIAQNDYYRWGVRRLLSDEDPTQVNEDVLTIIERWDENSFL